MSGSNQPWSLSESIIHERLFGNGQGRPVAEETFYMATRWSDPERDVRVARELAIDLLKRDRLFCVWTGKRHKEDSLIMITVSVGPHGRAEICGIFCRRCDPLIKSKLRSLAFCLNVVTKASRIYRSWWSAVYTDNDESLIGERVSDRATSSLPGIIEAALARNNLRRNGVPATTASR